jgi:hypothetical protein
MKFRSNPYWTSIKSGIVIARSEEDSFALLGTGCAISYLKESFYSLEERSTFEIFTYGLKKT